MERNLDDSVRRVFISLPGPKKWKKIHGAALGDAGWPDWLLVWRGRVWFLEGKTQRGVVARLQAHVLKRIAAAGGDGVVCAVFRSVGDLKDILDGKA